MRSQIPLGRRAKDQGHLLFFSWLCTLSTQPLEEGGRRFESQLGYLPTVRPQRKLLNLCETEFPFLKDSNYNPISQVVVRTEQYIKCLAFHGSSVHDCSHHFLIRCLSAFTWLLSLELDVNRDPEGGVTV